MVNSSQDASFEKETFLEAFESQVERFRRPGELAEFSVSSMGAVFKADLTIWNDHLLPGMHPIRACFSPAVGYHALTVLEALIQYLQEHPLMVRYRETGEMPEVYRLSDLISDDAFRASNLYREVYRPLRIRYQMAILLPAPLPLLRLIVFNRWREDFSAGDLNLAAAVRPILSKAVARTHILEDAEISFLTPMNDPTSGDCISLSPDLKIRDISPNSHHLLQSYCGANETGDRLPAVLEKWVQGELAEVVTVQSSECYQRRLIAQTVMCEGPRQLVLTLVLLPHGPVVLLNESDGLRKSDHRAWDHLTERKLEILRWVVDGKTNDEIGIILDISTKAVEKHVADLCRTFGVNNRIGLAREYFNR